MRVPHLPGTRRGNRGEGCVGICGREGGGGNDMWEGIQDTEASASVLFS